MLKRFLVFISNKDQCCTGWDSLHSDHNCQEDALSVAKSITGHLDIWDEPGYDGDYDELENEDDYNSHVGSQVVDTETKEVIEVYGYEF